MGCVKLGLVMAVIVRKRKASHVAFGYGSRDTATQVGVGCVLVWQSGLVMSCSVWARQLR